MGVARRLSACRTVLDTALSWAVPSSWSDEQAASVPHAYATVSTQRHSDNDRPGAYRIVIDNPVNMHVRWLSTSG